MVLDAVSNFVRGRVSAAVATSDTTVSVEDASIFPDPATDGEYNLVIWDANNFPRPDQDSDVEIVRVTARDTGADELTVVRAQETTIDVAHPEGSAVHLSPTAKMFSDIEAEYTAQGENFDGEGRSEFSDLQSVKTKELNTVPQIREQAESGSGTKADPFVISGNPLSDYTGLLNLGKGWFETAGIETDPTNDYAEESAYLQGDGIRTSTLLHSSAAPDTPTVLFQDPDASGGNFGGIRNMTVYGAGEGDLSGSANIVESDGNIIDLQFKNVIIRYGGGDCLNLPSCSGLRVQNCWLENVSGNALTLADGNRCKISNVHTLGIGGNAFRWGGTRSQLRGLTVFDAGTHGIETYSGASNNVFSDCYIEDTTFNGLNVATTKNKFSDITINNAGNHAIRAVSNGCEFYGIDIENPSNDAAFVSGNDNHFELKAHSAGQTITIDSAATDNYLRLAGFAPENVTDNGTGTEIEYITA